MNLHDRETAAMWAVRESLSSMVTPRFLAEEVAVAVTDPRVIERWWEMEGLAGWTCYQTHR